MAAADFGVYDEVSYNLRVMVKLVEDVVDGLFGHVVTVSVFDVVADGGIGRLDFGCMGFDGVRSDAVGCSDVELHQSGDAVVFLVVKTIVLVLKLLFVVCAAVGIVRVVGFDEGFERLFVLVYQSGDGKVAGDFP